MTRLGGVVFIDIDWDFASLVLGSDQRLKIFRARMGAQQVLKFKQQRLKGLTFQAGSEIGFCLQIQGTATEADSESVLLAGQRGRSRR